MLLTGDARSDDIWEGLVAGGFVQDGKCAVDVLKLPHHGSVRNMTEEFLRNVVARHIVISANGRDCNPDLAMLKLLMAARGDDDFTVYLTNPVPHAVTYLTDQQAGRRRFKLVVRDTGARSIQVAL